jgi:uncharacterized protein (DUF1800 family)
MFHAIKRFSFRGTAKLLAGAMLAASCSLQAQTLDRVFSSSIENQNIPTNQTESARFLTQATFGPTVAETARLRQIGYANWIAEQQALAPTLFRPTIEQLTEAQYSRRLDINDVNQDRRIDLWFYNAIYANDQLRQRVAFALSQILVVSDRQDNLGNDVDGLSEYYDILLRNAFGNYRTLLREVTLTPQMGKYLSALRNRSQYTTGNPPTQILPDENYAREIMQLFSFGLIKRNNDFSPALVGGNVQPTYDQNTISNLARVFTGLTYITSTTFYNATPSVRAPEIYAPMNCMDTYPSGANQIRVHDNAAKTIFDGIVMPAGQSCINDLDQAISAIYNHPTTGPFISRQLIQRLVTTNPSSAYIGRVTAVFNNNGSGVRGDLGAVVRAILLDSEARAPVQISQARGKIREPLLRLTALWRAFSAQAPAQRVEPQCANVTPHTCEQPPTIVPYIPMGITGPQNSYLQRPLGAPTVFNFYEPDFQQAGAIANANLFSPELQIINEVTTALMANDLRTRSFQFVGMTNPPATNPLINLSELASLSANPDGMIELINQRLLNGLMSQEMRVSLRTYLTNSLIANMTANNKAAELIHIVLLSPEFAIQL